MLLHPYSYAEALLGGGASAQSHYYDAYNGVSTRAAYKVDQHWTVGVDVENLLDCKYSIRPGIGPAAPRSYMLTLRGDF
ncbi:hypothetical protein D9M69_502680 [compost metagenome]